MKNFEMVKVLLGRNFDVKKRHPGRALDLKTKDLIGHL